MGRAKKSQRKSARKNTTSSNHSTAATAAPKPPASPDVDTPPPDTLPAHDDPTIPSTKTVPLFSVTHIPGRGLGLIANSTIPAGARIISESPVLLLPPKYTALRAAGTYKPVLKVLTGQYNALSIQDREQILLLCNPLGAEIPHSLLGTFMSNCRELDEVTGMGLCLNIARINHSCVPNAVTHWNRETERLNLHAVREIAVGEEVTLSYIMLVKSGVERRRELKEGWRFVCKCEACMLADENKEDGDDDEEEEEDEDVEMDGEKEEKFKTEAERDKLITTLLQLRPHIQQSDSLPYKVSLRCREKAITIFRRLQFAGQEVTTCLFGAAMKALQANDSARKNYFLQIAYENILMTEGLDSLEMLLAAPTLPSFADVRELSAEAGKAVGEKGFEDWLWGDDRVEI